MYSDARFSHDREALQRKVKLMSFFPVVVGWVCCCCCCFLVGLFVLSFVFVFYNCIVSLGFLSKKNRFFFSRGKASCDRVPLPNLRYMLCVLVLHNLSNSDMDERIFNVRTDVNTCDCTRLCTDTARESALKVDSARKSPCLNGESNLRQRRADSTLCRLSYIPAPVPKLRSDCCDLHTD